MRMRSPLLLFATVNLLFAFTFSSVAAPSPPPEHLKTFLKSALEASLLPKEQKPNALRQLLSESPTLIDEAITGKLFEGSENSEFSEWLSKTGNLNTFLPQSALKKWLIKTHVSVFGPGLIRGKIQKINDATAYSLFDQLDQFLNDVDPTQTPFFAILKEKLASEPKAAEHMHLLEKILPVYYRNTPLVLKKKQLIHFLSITGQAGADLDAKYLGVIFQNSGILIQRVSQNIYSEVSDPAIKDSIRKNLSQIPAMPSQEAIAIIESKLGPLDQVFSKFNPEAIGAGAVAQVHQAWLLNGEKVAVKVGRPIRESLDIEFEVFRKTLAGTPYAELVETYYQEFLKELDLRNEAKNIDEGLYEYGSKKTRVGVATRIKSLPATETVLVMNWIEGETLSSVMERPLTRSQLLELGAALMDRYELWLERALFISGFLLSDGHSGNIMVEMEAKGIPLRIDLIDFGKCARLDLATRKSIMALGIGIAVESPEMVAQGISEILKLKADQKTIVQIVKNNLAKTGIDQEKMIAEMMKELAQLGFNVPSEIVNFALSQMIMAGQIREINDLLGEFVFDPKSIYQKLAFRHALSPAVVDTLKKRENVKNLLQSIPGKVVSECNKFLSGSLKFPF